MKILIDQHRVQDIPVLEFYNPEATAKLPLVLLLHGFTGCKEHSFAPAYALARAGFYAVALDLHLHGELGETPFAPARVAPRLEEVIRRSAGFIAALINAYRREGRVDSGRTGLLGISLGGAVIHEYLPQRDAGVQAAVALVAGARPFWQQTMREIMRNNPELGLTEALLAKAERTVSPQPFLAGVTDFPLLWQFGQEDPIIPIAEVRKLHAELKSRYTRPERFELIEYPGTGHETPPAMYEQALEWFIRYLMPEAPYAG